MNANSCQRKLRTMTTLNGSKLPKGICLPGLFAKFEQNPVLENILKITGTLTLVESSYDTTWDTRIPLHHKDCLKKSAWTLIGLLGEMLMGNKTHLSIQQHPGYHYKKS